MVRFSTAAILLAAGESSRMGRPKPLLDWGDETLIEYQVHQLRDAGCDPVIVVLGAHEDAIRPLVQRAGAHAIVNERFAEGRATSARVGAGALGEGLDRALILNVDQPRPAEVHRRLLEAMERADAQIAVAAHDGRRGHPVAFDHALFQDLREVQEATEGIREVMQRHQTEILEVPFGTPVVLLDLNSPEDYESARTDYFKKVAS